MTTPCETSFDVSQGVVLFYKYVEFYLFSSMRKVVPLPNSELLTNILP